MSLNPGSKLWSSRRYLVHQRSRISLVGMVIFLTAQAQTSFAECPRALGMENMRIPDSSIRASTAYSQFYQAANGRLNFKGTHYRAGGWLAKRSDKNPWLEINFGSSVTISKIATQGMHGYGAWVKSFIIGYRNGGEQFVFYNKNQMFEGNGDQYTIVIHVFKPAIIARVIRIYPKTWRWYAAMRGEFYGCRPVSQGNVTGEAISAQSVRIIWQVVQNSGDYSLPCGFKVGYRVRTTYNNGSWINQTFNAITTEYTIHDLFANTTYEVYVEALNDACSGRFSPTVWVTTHETAPSAPPQNVTVVEVTYNSVVIQWLPPPPDSRNGRILQYSIKAWRANEFMNSSISRNCSHDSTSLEQKERLLDLESGTKYKVILTASNSAGSSPASFPLLFTTLQGPTEPIINTDEITEKILHTTQESKLVPTISNENQKEERTVSRRVLIAVSVALTAVLVIFLLVALYVFNKRRNNKRKEKQQKTSGVMVYNNDISLSRAIHQLDSANVARPLSPAGIRKTQLKQHEIKETDHLYYNCEEIAKQNNLNQMNSFNDDVYSYANPEGFRTNHRQKENESSQPFIERNPVYDVTDNLRSTNGKTDLQYTQGNPIYSPVSSQPSFLKQTRAVASKSPVFGKTRKLSMCKVEALLTRGGGRSSPTQSEPEYYVLEGPDPSTPTKPNSFSDDVYDVLYSNDSALLEDKGSCDYDVLWCSTNQPQSNSRNPKEFHKPSTCKDAVHSSKTYEKLWLAKADNEPEFRNAEDVIYDNTYETVGDSFA